MKFLVDIYKPDLVNKRSEDPVYCGQWEFASKKEVLKFFASKKIFPPKLNAKTKLGSTYFVEGINGYVAYVEEVVA